MIICWMNGLITIRPGHYGKTEKCSKVSLGDGGIYATEVNVTALVRAKVGSFGCIKFPRKFWEC